jgi:hypothetical protein
MKYLCIGRQFMVSIRKQTIVVLAAILTTSAFALVLRNQAFAEERLSLPPPLVHELFSLERSPAN